MAAAIRGTGALAGLHTLSCYYCLAFPPQNTLTAEEHSPEDSFTLNPEERGEYPDLQAAHRPFPKEQFRQENGHTSLQRDGPRSFLLDLPNFPDLSKADINGQNPNIQVQIFVNI